jgi:hypothetical protein
MASAMIGGLAVARAAARVRPEISDEILGAVRRVVGGLAGEPARPRAAAPARARPPAPARRRAARPRAQRR